MLEPKVIYCEAAIFACCCCGYEAEIYADNEWAETHQGIECSSCHSTANEHFASVIIYREDVKHEGEEDQLLSPNCSSLPSHLENCEKCIGRDKIHWTEFLNLCPKCSSCKNREDTMAFKAYVEGKHRDHFYKQCEEWAKPEHPWMPFLDEDGKQYFILNGLSSGLSGN